MGSAASSRARGIRPFIFHTFQAVWASEESRRPLLPAAIGSVHRAEGVPILNGDHIFATPVFSYTFRLLFWEPPAELSLVGA